MGDLFKSKSTSKTDQTTTQQASQTQTQSNSGNATGTNVQTTNTGPSQFQSPFLNEAFQSALTSFNNSKDKPFYQGDLWAGMTDQQKADNAAGRDFGINTGMGTAKQLTDIGSTLGGYSGKIEGAIADYLKLTNGDANAEITAAARAYADNPYVNEQIDAVNRDVMRQLNEDTLPGIDRQASQTGNINSSRAGVAAGIAQRGASDRAADNAASIRSKAYESGLALAARERESKMAALQSVIGTYSGLTGQGISALNGGSTAGFSALEALKRISDAEQADRQGQLTADFTKWQGQDSRETDLLKRFYDIVGRSQWGESGTAVGITNSTQSQSSTAEGSSTGSATQKGTTTTTSSPGLANIAMGSLSLAGGLGWKPFAVAKK